MFQEMKEDKDSEILTLKRLKNDLEQRYKAATDEDNNSEWYYMTAVTACINL